MEHIKVHAEGRWMDEQWGIGGEWLWAIPLGYDKAKLANVPFFTKGLAIDDVVAVDGETREITELLEPSDQVPFVVVLVDDPHSAQTMLDHIHATPGLDAHCEGGFGSLLAVNVPKAKVDALTALLESLEPTLVIAWEQTR